MPHCAKVCTMEGGGDPLGSLAAGGGFQGPVGEGYYRYRPMEVNGLSTSGRGGGGIAYSNVPRFFIRFLMK